MEEELQQQQQQGTEDDRIGVESSPAMAAAGGGRLSQLWTDWGIQILVLVSFSLQVLLLLIGGMRRRGLSAGQRAALWLAYLLADSTAIYALGHLSITSESREHRLVAFWAPFLLLHLGGPHNITAYALEDNRLWLRHLQTLVVQALGAAYVLYKYMAGSGALLLLASVTMFVVGLSKYGERTWALRCASKGGRSPSPSLLSPSGGGVDGQSTKVNPFRFLRRDMGDDEILDRAHTQFPICMSLFNDTGAVVFGTRHPGTPGPIPRPFKGEDVFKLLELELSLMYDTLYTKAPVIHTWYGFCIHFISLVGTSAALCFFRLSVSSRPRGYYSRADVAISYVLLAGALVLETMSACRALMSSWTSSLILCKAEDYTRTTSLRARACLRWLHRHVLSSLRKPFKPASRRLWRGAMGQYNLLHVATRDRTDPGSRLAARLGLQDSWDKLHFSGTFSGTDSLPMPRLKELLEQAVRREGFADQARPLDEANWRGRFILQQKQAFKDIAEWAVQSLEFDEGVVVWHLATDIFIRESTAAAPAAGHSHDVLELVEATRVLSNYMMFLLVAKPNMLPGRERDNVHLKTSRILEEIRRRPIRRWPRKDDDDDDMDHASRASSGNQCCVLLKELFHHEGPDCSSGISEQARKLVKKLCDFTDQQMEENSRMDLEGKNVLRMLRNSLPLGAVHLAKQLLHLGRPDTLELIFAVWVEIMLYASEHCPRDSHARELGNGCEFMTIIWLLVQHYNHLYRFS